MLNCVVFYLSRYTPTTWINILNHFFFLLLNTFVPCCVSFWTDHWRYCYEISPAESTVGALREGPSPRRSALGIRGERGLQKSPGPNPTHPHTHTMCVHHMPANISGGISTICENVYIAYSPQASEWPTLCGYGV